MRSCFDECVVKLNSHPSINKNIYILVEKHITPPQAVVQKGVYASLATQIYLQPKVKNTGEIIESQQLREKYPGAYDIQLYNQKHEILEATSSNFFGIIDSQLFTEDDQILEGITRDLLLEEANKILPLSFIKIQINQLDFLSEAFISSSSRGVIPVVNINGSRISNGKPGEKTLAILEIFRNRKYPDLKEI